MRQVPPYDALAPQSLLKRYKRVLESPHPGNDQTFALSLTFDLPQHNAQVHLHPPRFGCVGLGHAA